MAADRRKQATLRSLVRRLVDYATQHFPILILSNNVVLLVVVVLTNLFEKESCNRIIIKIITNYIISLGFDKHDKKIPNVM